jgi:hypothetical protein
VGSKATLLRHLASSLPSVKFPERMRPSPAPRRGAQSQPRRKPPPKGQSQGVKGSSSGILFGAQVHPGVCSRFRRPELPDMATVVEEWPGLSDEEAVAKSRQMFNERKAASGCLSRILSIL